MTTVENEQRLSKILCISNTSLTGGKPQETVEKRFINFKYLPEI